MSSTWKGYGGVLIVAREPVHDAETGVEFEDRTWAGSLNAILGLGVTLRNQSISYRISKVDGPVYALSARIPINEPIVEDLDRYEITTEGFEKSLFELPGIVSQAELHDSTVGVGSETYREKAESSVRQKAIALNGVNTALFDELVRNLKAGVTGFQIDFVVLRRFRKVDLEYAYSAGKVTLDGGLTFYSTAQLNLPATVAFSLPDTPYETSADYSWGWRKRGQRVEIVGNYAEQTVELVFAPWSLLAYSASNSNLIW